MAIERNHHPLVPLATLVVIGTTIFLCYTFPEKSIQIAITGLALLIMNWVMLPGWAYVLVGGFVFVFWFYSISSFLDLDAMRRDFGLSESNQPGKVRESDAPRPPRPKRKSRPGYEE